MSKCWQISCLLGSTQVKRASQSMIVALGTRQLLQGPEDLETDKDPWRPWRPWKQTWPRSSTKIIWTSKRSFGAPCPWRFCFRFWTLSIFSDPPAVFKVIRCPLSVTVLLTTGFCCFTVYRHFLYSVTPPLPYSRSFDAPCPSGFCLPRDFVVGKQILGYQGVICTPQVFQQTGSTLDSRTLPFL